MLFPSGSTLYALLLASATTLAQQPAVAAASPSEPPPPLSTPGPLFVTPETALRHPTTVIAYGDMRFTDPSNVTDTSPYARRALVARIVEEQPDAVLLSGDIPYHGGIVADYTQYATETEAWRTANLRVYPALGNHEFSLCVPVVCLHNWWAAFPELNYRRWYGAQLGASIYAIALDSDTSLLPGSDQRKWLELQVRSLPKTIQFVFISLHHPPVADVQTRYLVDHNPRPNEISLAEYLKSIAPASHARFIVVAGHTHNYERFLRDGVTYFVSGGGGAQPYRIDRSPSDLYQDASFPNYHFLRFVLTGDRLNGTMFRLVSTDAPTPVWEAKDSFVIKAK
jgi:acid phosphatase type 7